jgi:glycosyltransferase involved in cell wall biosynthesis
MARICLVSPVHVWVNPRLVKEADALHAAGHDVVVGYRADSLSGIARDDVLLRGKPWRWHRFGFTRERHRARWFLGALVQKLARALASRGVRSPRIDAEAYCRGFAVMTRWAVRQRADLYIAHTHPVLPVAQRAASAVGAPFAFDCEDLLAEEAADGLQSAWLHDLVTRHEARYLPPAAYVSATSVPMRDYLRERYRLGRVPVWHNAFPLRETADLAPPRARPPSEEIGLAWMSATIGPGRGIEDVATVLPRVGPRFRLHLYGNVPAQHQRWMDGLRASLADPDQLQVHPLPKGADVMRTLARHQVGLSLDQNDCLNRSLTVCNKTCLYLQAGLAGVATNTPGQASVLAAEGAGGVLYEPGDVDSLERALRALLEPGRLTAMQSAAWQAGVERYNWDVEQRLFLAEVERALALGARVDGASRVARMMPEPGHHPA